MGGSSTSSGTREETDMKYIKVYYTLSPVTCALGIVVDATEVGRRIPLTAVVEAEQAADDFSQPEELALYEAEKLIATLNLTETVLMGQFRVWDDAKKKWIDVEGNVYEQYNDPHPNDKNTERLVHFHVDYMYQFDAYVPDHIPMPKDDEPRSKEFDAWCAETAERNPFGDEWPKGVSWTGTTVTDADEGVEIF
jgi:hypothetical protein